MADYNSSLPIRTENAGDASIKVVDSTVTSQGLKVNANGSIDSNVTASSLPLPAGASTSALQTAGNASVASIDTKTPALGQALAASSVPVVLTAAQLSTLTPLTTVAVTGTFFQATQPVSAVSLPLPTGASTAALQTAGNASLTSIDSKLTAPLSVTFSAGTSVNNYNTVASLAAGASSTHTYTSTGAFKLNQIKASGSGKLKIEIQVNGATVLVMFNSTSNPNMDSEFKNVISVANTQTVTIIRTNKDNQPQDVYSTICGYL